MKEFAKHAITFAVNVGGGVVAWAVTHQLQAWLGGVLVAMALGLWAGRASAPVLCDGAPCVAIADGCCPCCCGCAEGLPCTCCCKKGK